MGADNRRCRGETIAQRFERYRRRMRKALSAVVIIAVALAAAIFPGTIGRGSASLAALVGVAYFIDGQSSKMSGRYPGTGCFIYATDQTFLVDDFVSSFWDEWQDNFARGFNRRLLERWPHLVRTQCGKQNPDFETIDDNLTA